MMGCRGEIRNPAALTPMAQPPAIAPPTSSSIPEPTVPPIPTVEYTIQEGDTLYDIATRYGTTVEIIQQLNGLPAGAVLDVGQVIKIPEPSEE
ncbi:MAG: LysM peptidoglycan-binding domain-containing protein [Anaerolineales bacterium]|nr:LysM peptidoglycan-binding domain-containing protein [Anaerolineales bacterium]